MNGPLNFFSDVFIGFHDDALASLILKLSHHIIDNEQILEEAKIQLLQSTAPDAIARICETSLSRDDQEKFCKSHICKTVRNLNFSIAYQFRWQ